MQAIMITLIICNTIIILSLISKWQPQDTDYESEYEETEDKEDEKD